MTIFLVVRGQNNVESLCQYLPRVHEAITITFDQSPIPVIGKKYQFQEIGEHLLQRINRALPKPIVLRLHLFPLARNLGKGAKILELPGTDKECMSIRELPNDIVAMLKGENPIGKTFGTQDPEALPKAKPREKPKAWVPRERQPQARAVEPAAIVQNTAPSVLVNKKQEDIACKKVEKIWSESFHKVGTVKYWIDRVYALDENGDGAVDNIGFNLKAENKPDLFIHYFPGKEGRPSVSMAPTLRLKDDRVVPNILCGWLPRCKDFSTS
ncbi:MAG: hypothetical protein HQ512_04240 [Rhodospirillales bacterium]|nr:hypothetical protein [Rhodospirillales bacterium]